MNVSIAIATYNGAVYLPPLLESLSKQTLLPTEIIAFDDCSTDETVHILKSYQSRLPITVWVNATSLGVVRNFKRAIAECTGDYIAFCDQDDIWLPEKLANAVSAMQTIDGYLPAMVYTDLTVVDQQLNIIADSYWNHRKIVPAKESFSSVIYGNIVTGCTMLINRPMAVEIARMPDEVLMHDFWIACVAYGIGRVSFIEKPAILYRQHTFNVTSNEAVTWHTRWQRLVSFLLDNQTSREFLMPEIRQARLFSAYYAQQLPVGKQNALNHLIALGTSLPILRKWRTFLVKFLHISV